MEALKKEFWKHAASVGGPADIEDIFLSWAADKKLAFDKAIPLWSSINKDIYATFGQKIADISVSGPAEELKKMMSGGGGESPLGEGPLEKAKEEIATGIDTTTPPKSEEAKKTLLDSLNEPDEESVPTPPTEGILPAPPAGGTPPPLPGASPVGAPSV